MTVLGGKTLKRVPESVSVAGGIGFEELAARYRLPLRCFFERRLRKSPDPDDLVQEVFLRLVRQGGIHGVQNLDGYIFQIAANVLRDHARRWAVRADEADYLSLEDTQLEGGFSPERVLLGEETLEILTAALHELSEKTAVIFCLYHFESVSQVEIARRLGMPLSTVEKHMARANAHILERLARSE